MTSIPVYYFGCSSTMNLQLFAPDGPVPNLPEFQIPFPYEMLYGDFCHARQRDIGEMTTIQVYGWTILCFWDNTISPTFRPSAVNFIAPGTHSTMGMLDLAVKHFPEVYRRVLPILKIREPSS
jgi:hypothetical protein